MATIDLSNYNLGELKGLQFDVEKEIKARQQQEVKKAREQILAIAQDVGLPVEALLSAKAGKSGKPGKVGQSTGIAQYRNPDDNAQTWTGRGRKPKWVLDALSNGKNLGDLRA
ncbi:MAG TPA: H-NS histone family protein [Telluria sp.]|jgi:DNA-binding protein H-NS